MLQRMQPIPIGPDLPLATPIHIEFQKGHAVEETNEPISFPWKALTSYTHPNYTKNCPTSDRFTPFLR